MPGTPLPCRLLAAMLALLAGMDAAWAIQVTITPAAPVFSPSGPYAIGRDTPVGGQALATAYSSISATEFSGTCAITQTFQVIGSELVSLSGNYATGVPGVSVNFHVVDGGSRTRLTGPGSISIPRLLDGPGELPGIEATLVVTGPVGAGTLDNGSLPTLLASTSAEGLGCLLLPQMQTITPVVTEGGVSVVGCEVTTPSISVTLPTISTTALHSSGSTAGDTTFDIGLACQPGTTVHVAMTDNAHPANRSELLGLLASSTAGGVKLRLYRDGNPALPVSYGPDSPKPGVDGQWTVGPSVSTSGIRLTVQYYRDGSEGGPLRPGTVVGQATFTLSYY